MMITPKAPPPIFFHMDSLGGAERAIGRDVAGVKRGGPPGGGGGGGSAPPIIGAGAAGGGGAAGLLIRKPPGAGTGAGAAAIGAGAGAYAGAGGGGGADIASGDGGGAGAGGLAANVCAMIWFACAVPSAPHVGQLTGHGIRSLTGSTSNLYLDPHWQKTFTSIRLLHWDSFD